MSDIKEALSNARIICSNFDLCDACLGRLYSKKLHRKSNFLLGKKLRKSLGISSCKKCYICKNTLLHLDNIIQKLLQISNDFEFHTFEIGTILKHSILDNDDLIRSKYKLKGTDSIKSDISKELSKLFSKRTKSKVDHNSPDLTLTINLKDESICTRTKSVYLSGRYTKQNRGLPQKQASCTNCLGKGCESCNYHGISDFNSIEGVISRYIFDKFKCMQIKFTWIGGEDKNSLVLGNGRPFFIKLINPQKRKITFPKIINLNDVKIINLKLVEKLPKIPIKFVSKISCQIDCSRVISKDDIKTIKNNLTRVVVYENSGKRSEKFIRRLTLKQLSADSFKMVFWSDGGLPVKRFIEGENVTPNVSDIVNASCKCKDFDFLEIQQK